MGWIEKIGPHLTDDVVKVLETKIAEAEDDLKKVHVLQAALDLVRAGHGGSPAEATTVVASGGDVEAGDDGFAHLSVQRFPANTALPVEPPAAPEPAVEPAPVAVARVVEEPAPVAIDEPAEAADVADGDAAPDSQD
jgi:hypothetical protein